MKIPEKAPSELVPAFVPSGLAVAKHRVETAEAEVAAAQKDLDALLGETHVACTSQVATGKGCGHLFPVKVLTYIQTHWYTEPYGCTGGDYWNSGEGQFICPNCGHKNRLYASPEVTALKHVFKAVEDVY